MSVPANLPMRQTRSQRFQFEGKEYEIRVLTNGLLYQSVAFLGDERANGYSHGIEVDTALQMGSLEYAIQELIGEAQEDIREHRWEKLMKMWNERGGL